MSQPFAESYLGQLRKKVGSSLVQTAAARAVLEDAQGRVLLIKRRDFGLWALPAGMVEAEESMAHCAQREVFEETGLTMIDAKAYGHASDPAWEIVTYPNGDIVHSFALLFYARAWRGDLRPDPEETLGARFFARDEIPPVAEMLRNEHRSLEKYWEFKRTGEFQVF